MVKTRFGFEGGDVDLKKLRERSEGVSLERETNLFELRK
jgi:hypothetical protein